jgi:hypothetical protein
MTLRDELTPFAVSGGEASHLIEEILDSVIVSLRRDQRFAGVALSEFDLLFADVRKEYERRLFNLTANHVHLDHVDMIDRVEQ